MMRFSRSCERPVRDEGFTLIELLIVITIMPLVVGAIAVALLGVFTSDTATSDSLTSSGDAQVVSAILIPDIQSATWVSQTGLNVCGGEPAGSTLLLSISPDAVVSGSIQNLITYVATQNATGNTVTIWRKACTGGTNSAITSSNVVTRNAVYSCSSTVSFSPSPTIQNALGNPCAAGGATGGWVSATGISNVSFILSEPPSSHASQASYGYTINAAPRPSGTGGAAPTGKSPIEPVMIIGGCPSALNLNGHTMTVQNGSGQPGQVGATGSNCSQTPVPKLSSATPYDLGATNPFSTLPIPTAPSPADPGSCNSSNVCTAGYYPSTYFSGGTIPDGTIFEPYLPAPGNANDVGAIVFQGAVSIGSSCSTGVTFSNGSTANGADSLTGTTYVFQQGLTVDKCSVPGVTFGSATYIFETPTNGGNLFTGTKSSISYTGSPNGLLWYMSPVNNGSVNISNGFSGSSFFDPSTSIYQGVVLWDNSCGSLSFGQGTGTGTGLQFNGGIYAPCASVQLGGGYNSFQVTFLAVNNFTTNGSATLIVG